MATEPRGQNTPGGQSPGRLQQITWLLVVLAISAALITWLNLETRDRVARNETEQVMKTLATVLPAGGFDNRPDQDRIFVTDPQLLGSAAPVPVYRARRGDTVTAVVISVTARAGYVGPIQLLVALDAAGTVIAVRAGNHQETPGLGDGIDADRSDWINTFAGRSLDNPGLSGWAVRRDGGHIDQITGATITSRAVVNAVRDAALYYEQHKAEILSHPPE